VAEKPADVSATATPPVAEAKAEAKPDVSDPAKAAPDQAAEKPAAPAIPEKYELKAPEGQEFNPAFIDALTPTLKASGVTAEAAQALVDSYLKAEAQIRTAQIDAWKSEVSADAELGGANAIRTTANIDRTLSWFSKVNAPEAKTLQAALKSTGFGEFPALVRFMNAIGAAMADDDTAIEPSVGARNGAAKRSHADVLYPNS
jgi:hypothetical protein